MKSPRGSRRSSLAKSAIPPPAGRSTRPTDRPPDRSPVRIGLSSPSSTRCQTRGTPTIPFPPSLHTAYNLAMSESHRQIGESQILEIARRVADEFAKSSNADIRVVGWIGSTGQQGQEFAVYVDGKGFNFE